MIKKIPEKYIPYIFVGPWIIGFLVFSFIPLIQSLFYSFNNVQATADGLSKTWVGIENYYNLIFTHPEIIQMLAKFLILMLIFVPLIVIFSLIIALLLNIGVKGTSFYRLVFFLPVIIMSGSVLSMLIDNNIMILPTFTVFSERMLENGNMIGMLIGKILNSFVFILWCTGVPTLIFLAGLQKMSFDVYEAAEIDGATPWEAFWKITFPNLKPMILLNVIYLTIFLATLSLNPIVELIEENLFNAATGIGWTSALAWLYFIIIVIVLLILGGISNGGFGKKDR